jgi:hypothetical protein
LGVKPAIKFPKFRFKAKSISLASNKVAPRIAGIETKKENRNAVSLSIFLNKSVEMVIPEREIPGITATPCVMPRINASLKLRLFFLPSINFFVESRIMPVHTSARPTARGEENNPSKKSFPDTPIIPVIKVTTAIRVINFILRKKSRISLKKKIINARVVPRCKIIEIARLFSVMPRIFCIMTRWPELLTGRNSVKPWIIPKRIYLIIFI